MMCSAKQLARRFNAARGSVVCKQRSALPLFRSSANVPARVRYNYTYDVLGNQISATGAQPTYGATVYNTFSEPVSFTDSTGDKWVWSYDTHGNLLSERLPSGDTTSYTVDTLGNRVSMTRPAPNDATGTVTTTYTRDQFERFH